MANVELYPHQIDAINKMKNGCILCGSVGTGKSRTALAYFYEKVCGGVLKVNGLGTPQHPTQPMNLYIITTAKKRDDREWVKESIPFLFDLEGIDIFVDSWNNITKYTNVKNSFFIFDEQRVVGKGAWVKAFIKISKFNQWILLSATPGDTWQDYIPVFIANGFYRNRTQFNEEHVVYDFRCIKYPKIDHYINTGILVKYRNDILVNMNYKKKAEQLHQFITCNYNKKKYLTVFRDRWDPFDECPIEETGKLCYLMRKVVNEDSDRIHKLSELVMEHPTSIIFYNYSYELDLISNLLNEIEIKFTQWNGQKHEPVPEGNRWCYLVQYSAGCEGWNCITTDTIIFYSQSYSYRQMIQAAGRIDRLNTPFDMLYYFHLTSVSSIDISIRRSLTEKKNFNEKAFLGI